MKKIQLIVLTMAVGLAVVSCKNDPAGTSQNEQATENVAADSTKSDKAIADTTAAAPKEEARDSQSPTASLKTLPEIVAKAKTDGAKWTVDQWKLVFKDFALIYKPLAIKMESLIKQMQDSTKIMDAMKELKKYEGEYKEFDKSFKEFTEAAQANPNGKKMIADQQWVQKTMDELGIPDL